MNIAVGVSNMFNDFVQSSAAIGNKNQRCCNDQVDTLNPEHETFESVLHHQFREI